MTKVSDAAKAAAVMHYVVMPITAGYDEAVDLFTELGGSHEPVDVVLDKFGAVKWDRLENMPDAQWWEELEMLAINIDAAFDHFEFLPKQV